MQESLRNYVIAEWRGLPPSGEEVDRTLSVREVLDQLAPKLGLEDRLRGVLQPTVLYELDRQWKELILTKLKKRFGGTLIKNIRFCIG
jgi:hypothetical protein